MTIDHLRTASWVVSDDMNRQKVYYGYIYLYFDTSTYPYLLSSTSTSIYRRLGTEGTARWALMVSRSPSTQPPFSRRSSNKPNHLASCLLFSSPSGCSSCSLPLFRSYLNFLFDPDHHILLTFFHNESRVVRSMTSPVLAPVWRNLPHMLLSLSSRDCFSSLLFWFLLSTSPIAPTESSFGLSSSCFSAFILLITYLANGDQSNTPSDSSE